MPVISDSKSDSKPTVGGEDFADGSRVYVVKKNDTFAGVLDYFRKQGHPTVTKDELLKANPKMKPDRLLIGEKIQIPRPGNENDKN
jgi:LysM domain